MLFIHILTGISLLLAYLFLAASCPFTCSTSIVFRYQSNTAKEVLDTILNIQPKDAGGGGGETRESIVYRLADDMLEKLPPDYVPHQVRKMLIVAVMFHSLIG